MSIWILVPVVLTITASATAGDEHSAESSTESNAESAPESRPSSVPWRGSQLSYEHSFSALSLSKSAEPTYNPYYAHSISLSPEWHFGDWVFLRGRFDIEQELTNSDETTKRRELVWSDLQLDITTADLEEPYSAIHLKGDVRLIAPVSKASVAETLIVGASPGVSVSRELRFLHKRRLSLRYAGRYLALFHRYTTLQYDAPTISCVDQSTASCGPFLHSGERNVSWKLQHGPGLTLSVTEQLAVSADLIFIQAKLYPLSMSDAPTLTDVPWRTYTWFVFESTYEVLSDLSVSAGASTYAPQLAPDGHRRSPFFNRFTRLYLNLVINIEALVERI